MSKTAMKLALEYISWQAFGECRIGEGPIPEAKDVVSALQQALAEPEQPMPPFESKRKAAMAIYTPPFRYEHGYIFDSQQHMVADNGPICDGPSVEGAVAARVRGWGRIVYMPNAKELQDEIGAMLADALNALYAKEPEQPARVPLTQPDKQRLWNDACHNNRSSANDAAMEFGTLVEAAHGIMPVCFGPHDPVQE